MRLKKEIHRIGIIIFCCVAISSFTIASGNNTFEDEVYYRSGKVLKLSKSGAFTNNDQELSKYTKGFPWTVLLRIGKSSLILSTFIIQVILKCKDKPWIFKLIKKAIWFSYFYITKTSFNENF